MDFSIRPDDVFEMAEQIEKGSADFYRQAAASAKGECRALLSRLADMESDHEQVFSAMKTSGQPADKDPPVDKRAVKYRRIMGSFVADRARQDLAARFSGRETPEQILQNAIDFERDTVVFLVGMKNMLTSEDGKKKVDEIIREELGHILLLANALASSDPKGTIPPGGEA